LNVTAFLGFETVGHNPNAVDSWDQVWSHIFSRVCGYQVAIRAARQVRNFNGGTGYRSAEGIGYGSEDSTGAGLAAQ
jgi:hypothetical protein